MLETDKIICIYSIRNIINNKIYIGQTTNFKERKHSHFTSMKMGTHKNPYLQLSYNKYGKEYMIMDIVEICTKDELNNKEIYWIKFYNSNNRELGYNLTDGGCYAHLSQESIEKIRQKHMGVPSPFKGTKRSKEFCKKLSKIMQENLKYNEENPNSKKVICVNDNHIFNTLNQASDFYNINRAIVSGCCNKKRDYIKRADIPLVFMFLSEFNSKTEEEIKNIIDSAYNKLSNRYTSNAKKVRCITTGKEFKSAKEASEFYKIDNSSILKCCKGKLNFCGKHDNIPLIWEYIV